MKRIFKLLIFVLVIIAGYFSFTSVKANTDLDRIDEYIITVDPNFDDGSLNIRIDIKWTVLDSDSEGPLTWVKIGVPNYHVENITPLTSNIKKIKYYSDDGSFIRIDFDRRYYKDDVVNFSFSFNQSYMYHIVGDTIYYDYHPGYFPEIIVDKCVLKWKADNIINIRSEYVFLGGYTDLNNEIIDGYYTYQSKLLHSGAIKVNLKYEKSVFNVIDPDKTYTDESEPYPWLMPVIVISIMALIFIITIVIYKIKKDPYKSERGFYGDSYWTNYYFTPWRRHRYYNGGVTKEGKPINPPTHVGGGYHGGGCACACACAGGGRAGCSMKDFYNTNITSEKLNSALKKDND